MKYCLVSAPSALEHQRVFLQVEQSRHSVVPSRRHNPRRSAIPQGRPSHPGPHDAAPHPYQSSPTYGDIYLQVLDQMVAKKHFLFSTDSYRPQFIKAKERLKRGSSEVITLAGPATRKPHDFKMFRANDDNKKQLCHLLLREWSAQ